MIKLDELKAGDKIKQTALHNECMPGGRVEWSATHQEFYVLCTEGKHFLHSGNLDEFEKVEEVK